MHVSLDVEKDNPLYNKGNLAKNSKRLAQYIQGIDAIRQYDDQFRANNVKIYLVDNTIPSDKPFPQQLLKHIPEWWTVLHSDNNQNGKYNKGAGLIDNWRKYSDVLKNSEWIIHYEPRLLLKDFSMFESILKNPRCLFTKGPNHRPPTSYDFNTGLMCISSKVLLEFIEEYPVLKPGISFEHTLSRWLCSVKNIQVDFYPKMGVIWFGANGHGVEV